MPKSNYINPRFYQNERTISLNPSKPFKRKRRKPKRSSFLKSLILVLVIFSAFIGYSAFAEDYYCQQKHVIGFLSEQDCLASILAETYQNESHKKVSDLMRTDVLKLTPNDSILKVAESMLQNKPKIYYLNLLKYFKI